MSTYYAQLKQYIYKVCYGHMKKTSGTLELKWGALLKLAMRKQ
jgi:hypothetical protein